MKWYQRNLLIKISQKTQEDNQTQFPIILSSYNGKGLKDAAAFESRSILSEYMDPLDCVFFSSNQNAAMHLMQRQETNVNEANAFRWRMRARSPVCTAVTCHFNPLTFTKTGIIFLIKKEITKRTEIYLSFNFKTFQNSSRRIIIQSKLSFQKRTGRNISIYFLTKAFLLIINNCLLKILFH